MRWLRQGRAGSRVLAAGFACALALAAPAAAATPAQTVSLRSMVADGSVRALATAGGLTYLGGDFTHVGPRTGVGAALDPAGKIVPGLPEVAGGEVLAATADGAGGWYLGGTFTAVGGRPRAGAAHVRTDGSLDPDFAPQLDGAVKGIAIDAGTIYLAGAFTHVGDDARAGLAAVDAAGMLVPFNAALTNVDGGNQKPVDVTGLTALSADLAGRRTTLLAVVGAFTNTGTQETKGLALVYGPGAHKPDGTKLEGQATGANPAFFSPRVLALGPVKATATGVAASLYLSDGTGPSGATAQVAAVKIATTAADGTAQLAADSGWTFPLPSGAVVRALTATAQALYVGGAATSGGMLTAAPAADPDSGSPVMPAPHALPPVDATVRGLAVDGDRLLVGGEFTKVGDQPRDRLAAVAQADGTVTAYNPGVAGGAVSALALSGTRAYAGGAFTTVNAVERRGIAAFDGHGDLTSFAPALTCAAPCAGPRVDAIAADGTTVWAGGIFTQAAGQARKNLAAFDAASGQLRTDFAPDPDGPAPGVLALALSGDTLYVGGGFTSIAGVARSNVAALDAGTGKALDWHADADQPVLALVAACDAVYAGGSFQQIGGADRDRIAELDRATGAARDWNPGASSAVYALARRGDVVYAGGPFTSIGGSLRSHIAALDVSSGHAIAWDPGADNTVRALALGTDALYAGGSFDTIGGVARPHLAALDLDSGAPLAWDPEVDQRVWALTAAPDGLLAGGDFRAAGAVPQQGFARFAAGDGFAPDATCVSEHRGDPVDDGGPPAEPEPLSEQPAAPPLVDDAPSLSLPPVAAPRLTLAARAAGRGRLALTVRLTAPARVVVTVERRVKGRWVRVRKLRRALPAGTRRLALSRLAAGRYRLTAVGADAAGRASAPVRVILTVRGGRR